MYYLQRLSITVIKKWLMFSVAVASTWLFLKP